MTEAGLATAANIAEILGALVVVGGVVFAIIQIRQFRRQRLEIACLELARSFQNIEFSRAHTLLLALPERVSPAELRQRHHDAEALAMLASTTFETIGVLVHHRMLPIALVDDLMGGTVVALWRKLEAWVESIRHEQGRRETHEWFQWLAEQLERRHASLPAQPAYEQHRGWRA